MDGPTSANSAGIGVEFESSGVVFSSPGCTTQNTNQAKSKQVGGRNGDNWQLTADTTQNTDGQLVAEYILNGQTIKIGTGAASAAAAAAASDIVSTTEVRCFSLLIKPGRSPETHTRVCPIISGTLTAINAIRG